MASAVIGAVAAVGKDLWGYIYPKIKNIIKFQSNLDCLRKEMENLMNIANEVKVQTEAADRGGHILAPAVLKWLKEFENIKEKIDHLESKLDNKSKCHKTCLSRCIRSSEVIKYLSEVKKVTQGGNFPSGLVIENYQVKKVEHIPGPSIIDQSNASQNLMKVFSLLNDESTSRIGVWGMGGVGKTTLVKNLNNMLETTPNSDHCFSIIIWATASKNLDLKRLQYQIVKRLNLEVKEGESMESTASRLHQRLKREKRFLFILDDVWEAIDLDYLGFSDIDPRNKIILTTRSMDVCRQMRTDIEVRVDVLNEDESWKLFIQNAGPVAGIEPIEPIARKVNHECCGLPLAVIIVGASMRGKNMITLWIDALNAFQKSVPYIKGIEDKVYKVLMWSYDSLFFQGMNVKSCFLYCCLYPEDYSIPVNELVRCWIAEGFIDESDSFEDSINTGISMVEYLKDSCLLELGRWKDTVKMHDVVRDVAIWIASSSEDECKPLIRSDFGSRTISEVTFQQSYNKISFVNNNIKSLPNCLNQYPRVSSLLLSGNSLEDIPEGFFRGFPGLRALNLNRTSVHLLPNSLGRLGELRTLLVQSVSHLPPLGGLRSLQVLDCSGSKIPTLPEGMENLTNLRLLNLSLTYNFHYIRNGMISNLIRLEILDMTDSKYTWNVDGGGGTPFDELRYLDHLSFLSICIKISSSAKIDFSWLGRVKRFHIIVGGRGQEIPMRPKFDEKKVILDGINLCENGIKSLMKIASCVVLINCIELERLWIDSDAEYRLNALKSLTISYTQSWFKFVPTRGGGSSDSDLLPNLEELNLHHMHSIKSISRLMQCLGSTFSRLRTISVCTCFNLRYLFFMDYIPSLDNLEEVTISSCRMFLGLYEDISSRSQKLKALKLEHLPELATLFGQQESWEKLEQLKVIQCKRIEKLPFTTKDASSIKEIRGEMQWWNRLKWDDENAKLSLEHYFKPVED